MIMLSVVLGKTTSIYSNGEYLTGDVVIKTISNCKILDLTINYCGVSFVSFIASEKEGKARICKKVEETEFHLDVLHPLIKSYRGVAIKCGVHIYPFSLRLPSLLPSSHTGPYGEITYYVHVHLQTSVSIIDVRKPFKIIAPVNINLFLTSQDSQCAEVGKKYGLIGNKTLRLKASVTHTCFVAGDVIPVVVEVSNETKRKLRYLFCTLKQIMKVLVNTGEETLCRETKQCLVTVAQRVDGGATQYIWRCQLPSPSTLTPTISATSSIHLTYCIQVSAKLNRVHLPPEVQIPVVFGIRAPITGHNISEDNFNLDPVLTSGNNRRRRLTVCSQPQLINDSRSVSNQLQSITHNLTRRLSAQLHMLPF